MESSSEESDPFLMIFLARKDPPRKLRRRFLIEKSTVGGPKTAKVEILRFIGVRREKANSFTALDILILDFEYKICNQTELYIRKF